MNTPQRIRQARILGLVFVVAGFVGIGVGWNGAARQACVDCQMPYLISGAAAGIGLILFGVSLLVIAQIAAERIKLSAILERTVEITPEPAPAAGGPAAAAANGQVVAGGSTYHRPECRLVSQKTGLPSLSVEAARSSGLIACRVCRPEEAAAPARA